MALRLALWLGVAGLGIVLAMALASPSVVGRSLGLVLRRGLGEFRFLERPAEGLASGLGWVMALGSDLPWLWILGLAWRLVLV